MSHTPWPEWGKHVLRPTRERLRLSRKELAQRAGLGMHAVLRLEAGLTRHPQLTTVRRLCNALDLSLPGDEWLRLSVEGITSDRLRRLIGRALFEFARRRRDAEYFVAMVYPFSRPEERTARLALVAAEHALAQDLLSLLGPDWDPLAVEPFAHSPPTHKEKRRNEPA